MKITSLNTLEDIFKAISDGKRVLCVDVYCPDAYNVGSMRIMEIADYIDNESSVYIFIALED